MLIWKKHFIDILTFYHKDIFEYLQVSFIKTNIGDTGPTLDNLFICTNINGKIVNLTSTELKIITLHHGKET